MSSHTLSAAGLAFIKSWESFRASVYLDTAGIPTTGYGHAIFHATLAQAQAQFPNGLTEQQACDLLAKDVAPFVVNVNAYVKVPLTQCQFDALVSFEYNAGAGALDGSTLLRVLNAGDYAGAAQHFLDWDKYHNSAGQLVVSSGLLRRRTAEQNMFLNGVYPSN
jgi:lysozyme